MIWIIWLLIVIADGLFNYFEIQKGLNIYHGLNGLYRFFAWLILGMCFGVFSLSKHFRQWDWLVILMYALGAFFSFWLLFNLLLNILRGKPLDYLGKAAILDRIESNVPFIAAVFWKAVLASGFIYAFYNTQLL